VESSNLLSVARHWWLTLLLATLLAGISGYAFASALPVEHEARVRMLVGGLAEDGDLRLAEGLTRTYAEVVTSEAVLTGVVERLDLPYAPQELGEQIRPTSDSSTRVVIVRAVDADAERAMLIANGVAAELKRLVAGGDAPEPAEGTLTVIDPATTTVAVGTSAKLIALVGAFVGLVASLTLALLLENLKQAVRDEDDLADATALSYLGSVASPSGRPASAQGFITETAPESVRAARYRMLATKVELIAGHDELRSLVVLGLGRTTGPGELAANIAKVLAERRRSVTLIDANPHTRELTTLLGLGGRPGLTDLLDESKRFEDEEVHPGPYTFSRDPRLFVMPFGGAGSRIAPHATAAPWLLERLLKQADFLVMNVAPPEKSAASLIWAGGADGTLLVVPRNRTRRADLINAVESLNLVGARIIGIVFEDRQFFEQSQVRRQKPPMIRRWAPGSSAPSAGRQSFDLVPDVEEPAPRPEDVP
jgi:polysaccharide biosynthesis transport protein